MLQDMNKDPDLLINNERRYSDIATMTDQRMERTAICSKEIWAHIWKRTIIGKKM